jgi:copper(I)-binding protein
VNRALRAATIGALLLSPIALSACSAGQVTQTATQERDKVGATAEVGDITVRAAELAYPSGGRYEEGDDAELHMAIVNTGTEDDALVDITGDGFDRFRVTGSGTAPAGESPTGGSRDDQIDLPADTSVFPGENAPTLTLVGLSESLTTGQAVELTLVFERAGEVTLLVPVSTPSSDLPRGESFDFHEEAEGSEEHGEG